ncbi:hypothetical protein AB0I22_33015 [Streptomyces sp. NPDC050610]|uniref:effector-associated constant component EACC1 n=1 Tax=Streptomyces sp. NPDC050610 TaxID=3157097 RepID=UPI003438B4E5
MGETDTHPELRLSVDTGTDAEYSQDRLRSLYEWLNAEDALRGSARLRGAPPAAGSMGAVLESVTVAVGSGGIAGVLARSVAMWLVQGRRSDVKVTVVAEDGRRVEVDVHRARDPEAVMRQVAYLARGQETSADG